MEKASVSPKSSQVKKKKGLSQSLESGIVQVMLGAECKSGAGRVQFMMSTLPPWQERGKVGSSWLWAL